MSRIHPLTLIVYSQGRTMTWLASRLGCSRSTLNSRLSGHRSGTGTRGPRPWKPSLVVVVAVASELQIDHTQLAEWLALEIP